jgi:hypothetical protein
MDLRSIHVFDVKKADNSANFAAGWTFNRMTHHNSLCKDKNKHKVTSYVTVHMAMSHVTLPLMRELSRVPTFVA